MDLLTAMFIILLYFSTVSKFRRNIMSGRDQTTKESRVKKPWTAPSLTRIDAGEAEGGLIFGPDLLVLGS